MQPIQWTKVLGWGPEELDDLRYVAYSYIKQGIYDVALIFFNALAVLTPQTAYDLQTLGALYLQLGENLKALDHCERALQLDSKHLPTHLNRAKALLALGDQQQAISQAAFLEKQEDPEIRKQAQALLGLLYAK